MNTKRATGLRIYGGCIVTMNPAFEIIEEGYLQIRDGRIVGLGPCTQQPPAESGEQTVDATGKLILPGFINAHTHAPMTLFRGIADDRELMDWLINYIFPAEAANVTDDFVAWGTRLACWEMIRSGTTTFADMYFFEDTIARVAAEAGVRAVVSQGIVDGRTPDSATAREGLERAEALIGAWKGHPLIYPAVGPHSAYACTPETLVRAKQIADQYNVPWIIHLAESQSENRLIQERYGLTPVRHLARWNLLGKNVVAAHGVWMDEEEIDLIKAYEVGVVHCPQSNMKLASGIAPVPRLLKVGAKLGLGTDSPASNNSLSMLREMSAAAKLHKAATLDPTVVTAREAVAMATIGSACALNLEKEIGSLEPGKRADMILLRLDEPNELPLYDVYSHVAYALEAHNVETVIVEGRPIMEEYAMRTLDTEAVRRKALEMKGNILRSLSAPHKG